jgi:hypothetical protein
MPGGNSLYGGTIGDFDSADNMAKEIENALKAVRAANGITQLLPTGDNAKDMRMTFIAIATGVINHIMNNPAAFAVQVTDVAGNTLDGNVNKVTVGP